MVHPHDPGRGLPDGFWSAVMRNAMTTDQADPAGCIWGLGTGPFSPVWTTVTPWTEIAAHLPDVLTVRAAVLEPVRAELGVDGVRWLRAQPSPQARSIKGYALTINR